MLSGEREKKQRRNIGPENDPYMRGHAHKQRGTEVINQNDGVHG